MVQNFLTQFFVRNNAMYLVGGLFPTLCIHMYTAKKIRLPFLDKFLNRIYLANNYHKKKLKKGFYMKKISHSLSFFVFEEETPYALTFIICDRGSVGLL